MHFIPRWIANTASSAHSTVRPRSCRRRRASRRSPRPCPPPPPTLLEEHGAGSEVRPAPTPGVPGRISSCARAVSRCSQSAPLGHKQAASASPCQIVSSSRPALHDCPVSDLAVQIAAAARLKRDSAEGSDQKPSRQGRPQKCEAAGLGYGARLGARHRGVV